MATKTGICILCQQEKKLNLEHVPPQGVGNKGGKNTLTGDLRDFISWNSSSEPLPREIKRQPKGNAYYTLCIDCNSKLGGAYVKHYVDFAKENKEFLYRIKNVKLGNNSKLTHSMKDVNSLRVAKEIVAMFFSVNGEVDSKDVKFLDSVRTYLKEVENNNFPIEKYKIVLNYHFPIFAPWMKELHLATDMIDNESTHNYIRPFVKHELGNGQKIRYSEIQYEGIGLTLIDLENSNYDITIGYDLKNFLTAQDKSKKILLSNVPVFTPNSILLMEKALEFPEESGADLLLREQRILNYIKSLNQKEREEAELKIRALGKNRSIK
ncbi:hypothetical protein ACN9TC_14310 [Lactococcus lactis]|uniref:hypothetical protein n=1 Tax=Lactococcus lactis TaxID=1358 RepID=UPI001F5B6193|nr:hypothetical protein [Lactococcus lactis]